MIDLDALEKRLRKAKEGQAYRSVRHRHDTFQVAAPDIDAAMALIAELKEARRLLKPFAVYCDINDLDERAADDTIEVPVGDLRLARAFLARNGKGEGEG